METAIEKHSLQLNSKGLDRFFGLERKTLPVRAFSATKRPGTETKDMISGKDKNITKVIMEISWTLRTVAIRAHEQSANVRMYMQPSRPSSYICA